MCPSFRTEVTAVQFQQIIRNVQFKNINLALLQPTQQGGPMQGQEISGHLMPCGSSSFQVTAGLVGIKQLTKRSQVEHFMSINYHFPGCCFHSLPTIKGDVAVESGSLFLCSEYLLRAAITVYCCYVLSKLGLAVLQGVQMPKELGNSHLGQWDHTSLP